MQYTVNTDGGSRGNPGPAAVGIVIQKEDTTDKEIARYIGVATNNVAEYTALLIAIEELQNEQQDNSQNTNIHFILDSELVVKQLQGKYKINDPTLKNLAEQIKKIQKNFNQVVYKHVKREFNKKADKLVNIALDEQLSLIK